ncbi:MAG TPA: hypothetical protein VN257_04255 [Actinotalea sp.]|nr:hypothetical protein [Actinotalea sp.]
MKTMTDLVATALSVAPRLTAPTGISFQGSGVPAAGSARRLRIARPASEPDSARQVPTV